MIGSLPTRNTLVSRLSSKIIPLEAPCQDIPDFPVSKGQVAHFLLIGVAQNAVSKNNSFQTVVSWWKHLKQIQRVMEL
jgi:membrane associated rhomboid family serine protease